MASIDETTIAKMVYDIQAGMSQRDVAGKYGVAQSTVSKYAQRYCLKSDDPSTPAGPPPGQVGEAVDSRERDGTCTIVTDKPLTLAEMCELFEIDRSEWVPRHFKANVWEGFYKYKCPEDGHKHRKVRLFQTKVSFERVCKREWIEAMKKVAATNVTPLRARKRGPELQPDEGFAVSWGLWDAHIGMMAWRDETGNDYDLDIARERIKDSVDQIAAELDGYNINVIWMPIGNDLLHFDNQQATTTFGDHRLDVDTRYGKVFQVGLECLEYMIEVARTIAPVDCFYIPGNHDYQSSYALTHCLAQRYRDDDRVDVDVSETPRKYRRFGGTLIGFDHGKSVKPEQLARIMPEECKRSWADTTYREWQIGHRHQRREQMYNALMPCNGVLVRTHPALSGLDFWHYHGGLIGEPIKSVEAFRYDAIGLRGSHTAWAMDDRQVQEVNTVVPDSRSN